MSNITQERKALITRILEGNGTASQTQRRAAFDHTGFAEPLSTLIDKVTMQAYRVTDGDIAAAKASGFSEDQIFELVVCAAIGQAARQHDSAFAALEAATKKE
jgi:alkylhydroperoxidase family enzyme